MSVYEKKYCITSYECDKNNVLRIRSLFNLFQDLADNHADLIGVGYHYCVQQNLGWVGSACDIEINTLPHWNDKIILRTWPSKTNTATAYREFEMINQETNEVYVRASTQWVLLDLLKMRPLPILKHLKGIDMIEKRCVDTTFEKLPQLSTVHTKTPQIIRDDDIDLNNHVNNAVYPSWILDTTDDDFLNTHSIQKIKIHYRKPATKKDKIIIQTEIISSNEMLHSITDGESTEFARIHIFWQKQ